MTINPYLSFNGDCEAAFKFYAGCLRGNIEFMSPYEGTPAADQAPPEWKKKIMHAALRIGDYVLMGVDTPRYEKPRGFSVTLNPTNVAEAERIFAALAEGGTIYMPLQQTFWARRFGMLVDRFSIPWMINCA